MFETRHPIITVPGPFKTRIKMTKISVKTLACDNEAVNISKCTL